MSEIASEVVGVDEDRGASAKDVVETKIVQKVGYLFD